MKSMLTMIQVMLQAGYKFNPYIAIEGRYWIGWKKKSVVVNRYGDLTLTHGEFMLNQCIQ